MERTEIQNIIEKAATPLVEESNCFIVETKVASSGVITLYLDSEEGLDIRTCASVSRRMSNMPELENIFTIYSLEVSSPGADLPLRHFKQYKKNIGRTLDVETTDGVVVIGELLDVKEDRIMLDIPGTKKNPVRKTEEIMLDSIAKAVIEINFK